MPRIGLNLQKLSREELEQYTLSLELFAKKSKNPVLHFLLNQEEIDISHQKRCEIIQRIPLESDDKQAIIDFLWQKIKYSQG